MNPTPHTRGPWIWHSTGDKTHVLWGDHGHRPIVLDAQRRGMQGADFRLRDPISNIMVPMHAAGGHPDAKLIADAPALALALQLIGRGLARIEPQTREFCFDGMRYSISMIGNGWYSNWSSIFDVIGWKRAYAALDAASKAVPA